LDEKTQVQALERTQPMLPLRPGQVERHTHDYRRNGVLDLYAALEIASGHVLADCRESHTGRDFLAFLKSLKKEFPKGELQVILDNSSTHKTPAVHEWLSKRPRIVFHFTPTSASWMNQVEGFFSILTHRSLRRTSFPSKAALRRHIEAFLANWNKNPTPFVWTKSPHRIVREPQATEECRFFFTKTMESRRSQSLQSTSLAHRNSLLEAGSVPSLTPAAILAIHKSMTSWRRCSERPGAPSKRLCPATSFTASLSIRGRRPPRRPESLYPARGRERRPRPGAGDRGVGGGAQTRIGVVVRIRRFGDGSVEGLLA
jgi:transposase